VRVAVALGAAISLLKGGGARAEVLYDLLPSAATGITSNARAVAADSPDQHEGAFATTAVAAGARYRGARAQHSLFYRLALTRFFDDTEADSVSNSLALSSLFNLSARVDLRLGATAVLSRTSAVDFANPMTVTPTGTNAGTTLYLTSTASQELSFQPNPRLTYTEGLAFSLLRYVDSPMPLPRTTAVAGTFRASRLIRRESVFLDARLTDSTTTNPALPPGSFEDGQVFMAQASLGWRHEFSPAWSSEVQAGPIVMFKTDGRGVLAPGASGSLNYSHLYWFATLNAGQVAAPNLYIGGATINDQVFFRLALPLGRSELLYVAGYGGYVFARLANDQGPFLRMYDQLLGGANLTAHARKLPFAASLTYMVVDQRGSSTMVGGEIPDLARQTVMVNITGTFTFGPGSPPIIGVQ
jgi:hypothetical protein